MKVAYFDCFSGVSGDMILGAMIDAGLDVHKLETELRKLHLSGFELRTEKVTRKGISGNRFEVVIDESQNERNFNDIAEIIDQSDLAEDIKASSKHIIGELAVVEAKIHNKNLDEVHFHELGALDSIVDVVGAVLGLKMLRIERVYVSKINTGTGFVNCRHGTLPVPAPATMEFLKDIPVYSTGIESELVTPTGISILKNVAHVFGRMPEMTIKSVGYGAGSRELEIPNLLRLQLGETSDEKYFIDEALLIETNIDDMNPEFYGHIFEELLAQGALDVFVTPVLMKKNRPGTLLSVLLEPEKLDAVLSVIFKETTTLGVRLNRVEMRRLARDFIRVITTFGEVTVKISRIGDHICSISPEYDDCRQIALEHNIPLKDVYDEAKKVAMETSEGR